MNSLRPECDGASEAYHACFRRWYASYIDSAPTLTSSGEAEREKAGIASWARGQKEAYEAQCGALFRSYRACIDVSPFLSLARFKADLRNR